MRKTNAILLLLILALLLSACGGDAQSPNSTDEVTGEPDTSREIVLAANGRAAFRIVMPQYCSEKLQSAVDELKSKLKSVTGALIIVSADYASDDKPVDSSGEIIVGNCKRTEMQAALSKLRYRDYSLTATDSNILIAGYEDSRIVDGVNDMIALLDEAHVTVTNGITILKWDGNYTKASTNYKFDSMTLCGTDISQYQIVYPAGAASVTELYMEYAQEIQKKIGQRCGAVLPIRSDASDVQPFEILLGKTNRAECVEFYAGNATPSELEYGIEVRNQKVLLTGGGHFSVKASAELFGNKISGAKEPALNDIARANTKMLAELVPSLTGDYRFMTYNILADYEGWGHNDAIPQSAEIRKEIVAGIIKEYCPDVVALQEVTAGWRAALPSLIEDSYAYVQIDLDNGKENACPLIYNKNRLKVVDSGCMKLVEGTAYLYKTITWAVFEDLETKERFAAFGTHWNTADYLEQQLKEAENMVALVKNIQESYQVPVFAMGDFNAVPGSQAYNIFVTGTELKNGSGLNGVDHIFCNSGVQVVSKGGEHNHCSQYASDHYSVWIDVKLK